MSHELKCSIPTLHLITQVYILVLIGSHYIGGVDWNIVVVA